MKVKFLLSNTKSYLQSMDQGIIANYKNLLSKKNIWSLDFARAHTHTHARTQTLTYLLHGAEPFLRS